MTYLAKKNYDLKIILTKFINFYRNERKLAYFVKPGAKFLGRSLEKFRQPYSSWKRGKVGEKFKNKENPLFKKSFQVF